MKCPNLSPDGSRKCGKETVNLQCQNMAYIENCKLKKYYKLEKVLEAAKAHVFKQSPTSLEYLEQAIKEVGE
jgi:hypothetical protein